MVVADRRNYVAALLTLDPDRLAAEAAAAGSSARSEHEAALCPRLRAMLAGHIEKINTGLARYESIRRFEILPLQLTVETGELTPTMKLKRRVVYERYAEEINALYA